MPDILDKQLTNPYKLNWSNVMQIFLVYILSFTVVYDGSRCRVDRNSVYNSMCLEWMDDDNDDTKIIT